MQGPTSPAADCQAAYPSAVLEEFANREADVTGDAAQQNGGDVTASVEGDGGGPAVCVPELLVGTLLAHLFKTELLQNPGDLSWLQNRNLSHGQAATVTV
jgi:hypothetical protein